MEAARVAGRWLLSFYASTPAYRPVLESEGWEELQPELNGCPNRDDGRRCRDSSTTACWRPSPQWARPKRWSPTSPAVRRPVDRVGFYTPSLISEATLGEIVDELAASAGRVLTRTTEQGRHVSVRAWRGSCRSMTSGSYPSRYTRSAVPAKSFSTDALVQSRGEVG